MRSRQANSWTPPTLDGLPLTFEGYKRPGGKTGTRNYVAILSSVNCSAIGLPLCRQGNQRQPGILDDYPNIDGIAAFTHGPDAAWPRWRRLSAAAAHRWGHAANPNIGAAVMIGLGCEVFQIPRLMETYGLKGDSSRFRTMTIQEHGRHRAKRSSVA